MEMITTEQVSTDPLPFARCYQLEALEKAENFDNLIPDIVVEEADGRKFGNEPYNDEQPIFFPSELINECPQKSKTSFHCYLIELKRDIAYDIPVHDIVLAMRTELDSDIANVTFGFEVDRGKLTVSFKYVGAILLTPDQLLICRKFQITLFRVLMNHSLKKLTEILDGFQLGNNLEIDYLLLPSTGLCQELIDWKSVASVLFFSNIVLEKHMSCYLKSNARVVQTKSGLLCTCMIRNSLVCTPHNGYIYYITGVSEDLNANSPITYKELSVQFVFANELLLKGRRLFSVQNYITKCRKQKKKEPGNEFVELRPDLCQVIMSPISLSTLYSFTFVPSIMHHLQSLLLAVNLKKMLLDNCMQSVVIPTIKVLEAITTEKCQESFHLESLETLGDSFLKYAASQHLFNAYQNSHEGLLSVKKEKIISNAALCKRGCEHKLPGFIHTEPFDPKGWIIPGDNSGRYPLNEEQLSNGGKIYVIGRRKIKSDRVADVVEALIGAFLSTGGESAGILFLNRIGVNLDLNIPYNRPFQIHAGKHVNLHYFELLLNYKFHDPSLLVEALTHGSFMRPEIPRCYQRLEFLGDAVLDYLITLHLYNEYPGMSPGLITDLRSASVNNDCYARSTVKHGLHNHILHASQQLEERIIVTVENFEKLSLESTFGWESEISFCEVLADVSESLAGAIYVDSGYNTDLVFQSIRPLLEPLVTPETVRFPSDKELNELCQKEHFHMKKPVVSWNNGAATVTIEVEANGELFKHTATAGRWRIAKKLSCKEVLKSLKESISRT